MIPADDRIANALEKLIEKMASPWSITQASDWPMLLVLGGIICTLLFFGWKLLWAKLSSIEVALSGSQVNCEAKRAACSGKIWTALDSHGERLAVLETGGHAHHRAMDAP